MQRSVAKILTTHVGSLPFLSLDSGIATGDETHLRDDVAAVVARQRETGIDIVNEGEYAKGGDWLRYMLHRFGGFTDIDAPLEKRRFLARVLEFIGYRETLTEFVCSAIGMKGALRRGRFAALVA